MNAAILAFLEILAGILIGYGVEKLLEDWKRNSMRKAVALGNIDSNSPPKLALIAAAVKSQWRPLSTGWI